MDTAGSGSLFLFYRCRGPPGKERPLKRDLLARQGASPGARQPNTYVVPTVFRMHCPGIAAKNRLIASQPVQCIGTT